MHSSTFTYRVHQVPGRLGIPPVSLEKTTMTEMTKEAFLQLQDELRVWSSPLRKAKRRTTPTLASKNWRA